MSVTQHHPHAASAVRAELDALVPSIVDMTPPPKPRPADASVILMLGDTELSRRPVLEAAQDDANRLVLYVGRPEA